MQLLEGSYFMDGNIYLKVSHPDYVLAHEMGHAAEEFLFKDNKELKEIKEGILNNSIIILKPYNDGIYYTLKSKNFVRP